MIFTADLLPHLCDQLDVRALGCLCSVNQLCGKYLLSLAGGKHWAKAGKEHCGEKYWNDRLFDYVLEHDDGRYKAMLHICPWMSAPEEKMITGLEAYAHLGAEYNILGMKALDSDTILDAEILFKVRIKANVHVHGGDRIVTMLARDEDDAPVVLVQTKEENDFDNNPTEEEMRLSNELVADTQFMKTIIRYGMGHMGSVFIVHQNMFAFVSLNGRVWDQLSVVFVSMKDRSRVLWETRIKSGEEMGIAFLPGEMWIANKFETVYYYGPRFDKNLAYHGRHEGNVVSAFWATIRGDATRGLQFVKGENLSRLVVPKTDLTLFDFAAGDIGWKTRDALPPDAQMLIAMEPRFDTTVFMLKQAIFRDDVEQIRSLVKRGRKRISHLDVFDALGANMEYDATARMLRTEGVFISAAY